MKRIIEAIKQLLEASVADATSPLSDIGKVIFGDPAKIPANLLPAICIIPASSGTEFIKRGSRYDQKKHNILIKLVYNREAIFNSYLETKKNIAGATYSGGKINFNVVSHGYSVGDSFQSSDNSPGGYNGAYTVTDYVDVDNFKAAKSSNPGTIITKGTVQKAIIDKVKAIEQALDKVSDEDDDHETDIKTICGIIQHNPSLPYTVSGTTKNTCEYSNVVSVSYDFNNKDRTFSTFEVIVAVEVLTIGDR